jgi:hypothetical protein
LIATDTPEQYRTILAAQIFYDFRMINNAFFCRPFPGLIGFLRRFDP